MRFAMLILALAAYGCESSDLPIFALAQRRGGEPRDGEIASFSINEKDELNDILPTLDKLPSPLELRINGVDLSEKELREIAALKNLRVLRLRGCGISDDDLKFLEGLKELNELAITFSPITDKGLKYLGNLENLKRLELAQTQIHGPGLAYLKNLSKLEWLALNSTPLDDRAMPLIAKNFKKLKRIDFGYTNVTPAGLMQLADLHWLGNIGVPNDIACPGKKPSKHKEEKLVLMVKFQKAHTASKQKARAAGLDVPPDWQVPFGPAATMLKHLRRNQQRWRNAPPKEGQPPEP